MASIASPRGCRKPTRVPTYQAPLTFRQRIFAWAWLSHGACLGILAGILGLATNQVQTAEWADAMTLVGCASAIEPARKILPAVTAYAPGMVILGGLCVLAAVLALWWHRRWALQAVALIHLPLLVLVTWWSHQLSAQVVTVESGEILAEILLLMLCLGMVGWSLTVMRTTKPPVG